MFRRNKFADPSVLTRFLIAVVFSAVSSISQAQSIFVTRLSGDAEFTIAPDASGFILESPGTQKSRFIVQIESPNGVNTAALELSPQYGQTTFTTIGNGDYFLDAPLVVEKEGAGRLYAFATSSADSRTQSQRGYASRGWLDSHADWFNGTFGSGWSESAGGVIHGAITTAVSNEALANASDEAILTGTVVVSIPIAIGTVAGGEVVLGIGTLGASGTTAAGTTVAGVTVIEGAAGTTTGIVLAEGTTLGTGTILVGAEGAGAAIAATGTTIVGVVGPDAAIGSGVVIAGAGIGIPAAAEIAMVGALGYTVPYIGIPGYNVLVTSEAAWTMGLNYAWLQNIVTTGQSVLVYRCPKEAVAVAFDRWSHSSHRC